MGNVDGFAKLVVRREDMLLHDEDGFQVVAGMDMEEYDRGGAKRHHQGVDRRRSSTLFLDGILAAMTYNQRSMKEQGAEVVEIKISNGIEYEITITGYNKYRITLLTFSLVFICSFHTLLDLESDVVIIS